MVLPWKSRGGATKASNRKVNSGEICVVETKIPTRYPSLNQRDAAELCRRLENATALECFEILRKIKNLGGETNKKCLVQNGIISALSSCFQRFASSTVARDEDARLMEEVLSAVTSFTLPLNRSEGFSKMGSTASLDVLVKFMNASNAKTRQNAAFCIREVISSDKRYVYALTEIQGACEGLLNIIKDSISTSATKSSLMVIYRAISSNEKIASRFVNLGLIELIVEMMIDNNAEKSVSERCIVVLNVICNNKEAKDDVIENALIVPLLVKKILRVSDLVTQCSVSILWKLWKNKNGENEDRLLVEALQVGAFEKLLVLLQVGCEERTKEKANELLRNLYRCRNEIEKTNCVESSMHLKNVKKSF